MNMRIRICLHCHKQFESYSTRKGYASDYCHECAKRKVWFRRESFSRKNYKVTDEGVVIYDR